MSHRYQSTLRLGGHKRTAHARTGLPETALTIIWPIQTRSPKRICSYIANIDRLGRSKSSFGHGSRSGDRTKRLKAFHLDRDWLHADQIHNRANGVAGHTVVPFVDST